MTKKSRDRRVIQRRIKKIESNPELLESLRKAWEEIEPQTFTKHECNGMTFYFADMPEFNDDLSNLSEHTTFEQEMLKKLGYE